MGSAIGSALLVSIEQRSPLDELLLEHYPHLRVIPDGESFVLRGSFPVVCEGQQVDAFKVEIVLKKRDDHYIPIVRELGHRIPRILDRHINGDGTACVGLPEELLMRTHGKPMPLLDFLQGPVHEYFFGQVCFESGLGWPHGEWRHGNEGVYDFLTELFTSTSYRHISILLGFAAADTVRGHWPCFCDSGKKIRNCHKDEVVEARKKMPAVVARILKTKLDSIKEDVWGKLAKPTSD